MREDDDGLERMLKRCSEVVIQSLEKNAYQKVVLAYLVEQKIDFQVEELFVNTQANIAKLLFQTHAQAMNFYENRSFHDKILNRKINVYFNLSVSKEYIKKYFLRGITEENVRKVFQKCRKFGIIRMDTLYGYKSQLKNTCILSYLRTEPLNPEEFKNLFLDLAKVNVKLDNYYDKHGSSIIQSEIKEIPLPKEPPPLPKNLPVPGSENKPIVHQPSSLRLLTVHSEQDDDAGYSSEVIEKRLRSDIQMGMEKISIAKAFLPTLNPKQKRILISRYIEYEDEEEAEEVFLSMEEHLKQNKINGIVYLYEPSSISTLLVTRPDFFIVRLKDAKCTIYERTEEDSRSVKLAELSYTQIDDFIVQKERLRVTIYKSSEMQTFGQQMQEKIQYAKESPKKKHARY